LAPPADVPEHRESPLAAAETRVFVRDGLRSYRRTYKRSDAYWGGLIVAGLLGVLGWVRYKGAHPDPSLYDMSAALGTSSAPAVVEAAGPGTAASRERGAMVPPGPSPEQEASSERGALPPGLGSAEFREGKVGAYTPDNLYVKINGRAEFYAAFGVKSMHAVTLESKSGASIDIELYDQGASRNALGTFNGERPPGSDSSFETGSTFRIDRNAAFLARGPYYVRFVGSDESPEVVAEVTRLLTLFRQALPGEELPWAFSLFVDQLKLQASQVSYSRENAFSFGFANDVYKATLSPADSQDNMEAFVAVKADAATASRAAGEYQKGFRGLGVPAGQTKAQVPLFKDEFLGSFSTATSHERFVIGVRGAPDAKRAQEVLESLHAGLSALPPAALARAVPTPAEPEAEEKKPEAAAAPSGAGESAAAPGVGSPAAHVESEGEANEQ
jgi:hypothetical protein